MPRFQLIAAVVATILVACSSDDSPTPPSDAPASGTKPNVILIVIDTARADHFSAYGYDRQTTPNIDALALDSVMFTNAHSVAPWTLPAHMSMFTGLLPGQHGATWNAFGMDSEMSMQQMLRRRFQPSDPNRMLTSRLREAGYRTWGVSSNPWVSSRTGFSSGFDTFTDIWGKWLEYEKFYEQLPSGLKFDADYDLTRTGMSIVLFKHNIVTDIKTDPFFAFFNFVDTHFPYVPPSDFVYKFNGNPEIFARISRQPMEFNELAIVGGYQPFDLKEIIPFYDAELHYADFMIGHLLDWLRERNLYNETLIIITSDHGEHLGENGRFSHQLSIEEELLRIPLIIKFPNGINAGKVIDNPLVSNLDLYQTILSATGQPNSSSEYLSSSVDLADMNSFSRDKLFAEYYFSDAYLRQIKDQHEPFEIEPHRIVRRAIYSAGHKITFENLEQTSITPLGIQSNASSEMAKLEDIKSELEAYVSSIRDFKLRRLEPATEDPEFIERLKSLGYLDGGTPQTN
jgi:arylsulfatase A-like enzyme